VSARLHPSDRHCRRRRRIPLPGRPPQDRQLTTNPLFQQDAHRIIRRRAKAAGIETRIGNHTFHATGITAYLKNSGKLEVAQQIANHESPRTTKLYDRRQDEISLDEIERIAI
jgi:site-specific recombinase XerD